MTQAKETGAARSIGHDLGECPITCTRCWLYLRRHHAICRVPCNSPSATSIMADTLEAAVHELADATSTGEIARDCSSGVSESARTDVDSRNASAVQPPPMVETCAADMRKTAHARMRSVFSPTELVLIANAVTHYKACGLIVFAPRHAVESVLAKLQGVLADD